MAIEPDIPVNIMSLVRPLAEERRLEQELLKQPETPIVAPELIDKRGLASAKALQEFGIDPDNSPQQLRASSLLVKRMLGRVTQKFNKDYIPEWLKLLHINTSVGKRKRSEPTESIIEKSLLRREKRDHIYQYGMAKTLMSIYKFNTGPFLRWMASTLTLNYQRMHVLKSMVSKITHLGMVLEKKIDAIRINTSIGDLRKNEFQDVLRIAAFQTLATSINQALGDQAKKYLGPLASRYITDPLKEKGKSFFESRSDRVKGVYEGIKETFNNTVSTAKREKSLKNILEKYEASPEKGAEFINENKEELQEDIPDIEDITQAEDPVSVINRKLNDIKFTAPSIQDIYSKTKEAYTGIKDRVRERKEDIEDSPIKEEMIKESVSEPVEKTIKEKIVEATPISYYREMLDTIKMKLAEIDLKPTYTRFKETIRPQRAVVPGDDTVTEAMIEPDQKEDSLKDKFRQQVEPEAIIPPPQTVRSEDDIKRQEDLETYYQRSEKSLTELQSFHKSFKDFATQRLEISGVIIDLLTEIKDKEFAVTTGDIIKQIQQNEKDTKGGFLNRFRRRDYGRGRLFGVLSDVVGGASELTGQLGKGYLKTVGGFYKGAGKIAGSALGLLNPLKKAEPFTDIFLKDQVSLGRPLVSKKRLEEGLVLGDGKTKIEDVGQIKSPVIDPKTGDTLITQEDVDHGLVDAFNRSIYRRGGSASVAGIAYSLTSRAIGTLSKSAFGFGFGFGRALSFPYKIAYKGASFLLSKIHKDPYRDIYRKGEIEPGRPYVSKRQLERGLVFAGDNRRVRHVADITEPVIDPRTGNTVITQEDIDHGLVDVTGKPITETRGKRRLFNILPVRLLRSVGKAGLNLATSAVSSMMKIYSGLFGLGIDITKMGARGISGLTRRLFGFDKPQAINITSKEDMEEVIGKRLDLILAFMEHKWGKDILDKDDDGDDDGSYWDYISNRRKEKMRKAGIANDNRKDRGKDKDDDGEDKGTSIFSLMGIIGGVATTIGGTYALLKRYLGKTGDVPTPDKPTGPGDPTKNTTDTPDGNKTTQTTAEDVDRKTQTKTSKTTTVVDDVTDDVRVGRRYDAPEPTVREVLSKPPTKPVVMDSSANIVKETIDDKVKPSSTVIKKRAVGVVDGSITPPIKTVTDSVPDANVVDTVKNKMSIVDIADDLKARSTIRDLSKTLGDAGRNIDERIKDTIPSRTDVDSVIEDMRARRRDYLDTKPVKRYTDRVKQTAKTVQETAKEIVDERVTPTFRSIVDSASEITDNVSDGSIREAINNRVKPTTRSIIDSASSATKEIVDERVTPTFRSIVDSASEITDFEHYRRRAGPSIPRYNEVKEMIPSRYQMKDRIISLGDRVNYTWVEPNFNPKLYTVTDIDGMIKPVTQAVGKLPDASSFTRKIPMTVDEFRNSHPKVSKIMRLSKIDKEASVARGFISSVNNRNIKIPKIKYVLSRAGRFAAKIGLNILAVADIAFLVISIRNIIKNMSIMERDYRSFMMTERLALYGVSVKDFFSTLKHETFWTATMEDTPALVAFKDIEREIINKKTLTDEDISHLVEKHTRSLYFYLSSGNRYDYLTSVRRGGGKNFFEKDKRVNIFKDYLGQWIKYRLYPIFCIYMKAYDDNRDVISVTSNDNNDYYNNIPHAYIERVNTDNQPVSIDAALQFYLDSPVYKGEHSADKVKKAMDILNNGDLPEETGSQFLIDLIDNATKIINDIINTNDFKQFKNMILKFDEIYTSIGSSIEPVLNNKVEFTSFKNTVDHLNLSKDSFNNYYNEIIRKEKEEKQIVDDYTDINVIETEPFNESNIPSESKSFLTRVVDYFRDDKPSQPSTDHVAKRRSRRRIDRDRKTVDTKSTVMKSTPQTDPNMLGTVSSTYESRHDSSAVGYDRTGGQSFGKYQIAIKTGTFDKFIEFVESQGDSESVEVANSLRTGVNENNIKSVWKDLAENNKIQKYEYEFIKSTHYDPALMKINKTEPELGKRIEKSSALKEMLWSTSVQHGAGRAADIFMEHYEEGMGNKDLVKAVYQERGTRFGSSTRRVRRSVKSRFIDESRDVLALLDEEEQQPVDDRVDKPTAIATATTRHKVLSNTELAPAPMEEPLLPTRVNLPAVQTARVEPITPSPPMTQGDIKVDFDYNKFGDVIEARLKPSVAMTDENLVNRLDEVDKSIKAGLGSDSPLIKAINESVNRPVEVSIANAISERNNNNSNQKNIRTSVNLKHKT